MPTNVFALEKKGKREMTVMASLLTKVFVYLKGLLWPLYLYLYFLYSKL